MIVLARQINSSSSVAIYHWWCSCPGLPLENNMILTFMRHPPVEAGSERCIGQTNVELSPEGRAALIPLAEKACRLKTGQNPLQ